MQKVTIKITSHWEIPHAKGYSIGDEYSAILHPCDNSNDSGDCYAVLDNGYTIPNGNFDVIKPPKRKKNFKKEFSQGYCCALCSLIYSHGIDTPIIETWRANFGSKQTVKSLKALGIDEHDIEIIKPHLKEINRER